MATDINVKSILEAASLYANDLPSDQGMFPSVITGTCDQLAFELLKGSPLINFVSNDLNLHDEKARLAPVDQGTLYAEIRGHNGTEVQICNEKEVELYSYIGSKDMNLAINDPDLINAFIRMGWRLSYGRGMVAVRDLIDGRAETISEAADAVGVHGRWVSAVLLTFKVTKFIPDFLEGFE